MKEKERVEPFHKTPRHKKTLLSEREADPFTLPSRKEVHKKSRKKYRKDKQQPSFIVHFLFYLFILLVGSAIGIGIWIY